MKRTLGLVLLLSASLSEQAQTATPKRVLIHVKTALSVDDAQICAAPNVAMAALKAGHKVTMLFDASAVSSVARGFGWLRRLQGRKN